MKKEGGGERRKKGKNVIPVAFFIVL